MHYCEACTAPKMPEFILYALHSAYQKLPWGDLHPDQMLMEAFFKVSPRSLLPGDLVPGAAACAPYTVGCRHSSHVCQSGPCPRPVWPGWYSCEAPSHGNHVKVLVDDGKTFIGPLLNPEEDLVCNVAVIT